MEGAAMFDAVLVPLDGSREAEEAISFAVEEATRSRCPLVLIRVVPRPEAAEVQVPHGGPARSRQSWSLVETQAAVDAALAYLRGIVLRHGLRPETELAPLVGDPFRRVEQEVARRSRPLVVLATEDGIGSPVMSAGEPMRRLLLSGTASVLRIRGPREGASTAQVPLPLHPPIDPGDAAAATVAWG
jgi:nucleotide-binding universal stress UspA family protein